MNNRDQNEAPPEGTLIDTIHTDLWLKGEHGCIMAGNVSMAHDEKVLKGLFYRFRCGTFVEAGSFEEARAKFIEEIQQEEECSEGWCKCTCLGLGHRTDCPQNPVNRGEIPY